MSDTPFSHQPCQDYIVHKVFKVGAVMAKVRGIFVPEPVMESRRPKKYGKVVAVGPGRVNPQTGFTPPLPCKVGDIVMIRENAGDPVVVDGEEYLWSIPDEILAVYSGAVEALE